MSIPCKTNCACLGFEALCVDANGAGTCYDPRVQECCTTLSGNTHFVCPMGSCCAGNSAGTCCGSNQECVNSISPPICCPEGMSASCNGTCYNPEESQCCKKELCPNTGSCCEDGLCCPSGKVCSRNATNASNTCCLEGQKSCGDKCYDPNSSTKCCVYYRSSPGPITYTLCYEIPCISGKCNKSDCVAPYSLCVDAEGHGSCAHILC